MKKSDQINESKIEWPVTFEQVEDAAQLREMLKASPAQRLTLAEGLLELAIKTGKF